jgi:hypothetical protein
MEEATKKALNLLEQSAMFAKEFIEKHGPQAWDAVLLVNKMIALNTMMYALFGMLCAVGFMLTARFYLRKMNEKWEEWGCEFSDGFCYAPFAVLCGMGVSLMLINLYTLANVWLWVRLFNPALAITHDVYIKVIN